MSRAFILASLMIASAGADANIYATISPPPGLEHLDLPDDNPARPVLLQQSLSEAL
jgi:hypothetical protein